MRKWKSLHSKLLAFLLALAVTAGLCPPEAFAREVASAQETRFYQASEIPDNLQALLEADAPANGRLVRSRSLYELERSMPDGGSKVDLYTSPVKYMDGNGEVQLIDTAMIPSGFFASLFSGRRYHNAANRFSVSYAGTAESGFRMDDRFTLSAEPTGKRRASKAEPGVSRYGDGKLTYPGAFEDGVDLEWVNITTGIEQNIRMASAPEDGTVSFRLSPEDCRPVLSENAKGLRLCDQLTGRTLYTFSSLYLYDSSPYTSGDKDGQSAFRHYNEDAYYTLEPLEDGTYRITVQLPEEFLKDPRVVYPVTAYSIMVPADEALQDAGQTAPRTAAYSASSSTSTINSAESLVSDTYVSTIETGAQNKENSLLRFGVRKNSESLQTYFRVHNLKAGSSLFGDLSRDVVSASLYFTMPDKQTTGCDTMILKQVDTSWSCETITWANKPNGYVAIAESWHHNFHYLEFDVSELVHDWHTGCARNYGVILNYKEEDYKDYNSVYASESGAATAPRLTITYSGSYGKTEGIDDGKAYYLKNRIDGKYLTSDSIQTTANVSNADFQGIGRQQWKCTYSGYGYYDISLAPNTGLKLDVHNVYDHDGTNIKVYQANASEPWAQQFRILPNGDGSYRLQPRLSMNRVVETDAYKDNHNVQLYTYYGTANQQWNFFPTDPFDPANIEYIRIKKYDQSKWGGDSDITTVVTKSYLQETRYFQCSAPGRAEIAFAVNDALKAGLNKQEADFQAYPNMHLPNACFHMAKNGVDDMVKSGVIGSQSDEYYGIWASEANRLLIKANQISSQIQLSCTILTTCYSLYNIVSSLRAMQQAYNTTVTVDHAAYTAAYSRVQTNYLQGGTGYSSFDAAKKALGPAGTNKAWHHIVEKNQIDHSGFSASQIHNTKNLVAIESGFSGSIHAEITKHYASPHQNTGGLTVRQWLAGKSFQFQFEYGLDQLSKYGILKPTSTGWEFIPY